MDFLVLIKDILPLLLLWIKKQQLFKKKTSSSVR